MEFVDLKAQYRELKESVDARIHRVLEHGQYIMGPEVRELEQKLSAFCGAKRTLACSNGTDALGLALRAMDVKAGDAVFVPTFTFAATAEVVAWLGATPVFVDVLPDSFNLDPASLEAGIATARRHGLKPAAVIDRKSTRLNSSHIQKSRMPSSA